jgi:hypothetical protein
LIFPKFFYSVVCFLKLPSEVTTKCFAEEIDTNEDEEEEGEANEEGSELEK